MAAVFTLQDRLAMTGRVLTALIANETLTTSAAVAATWSTTAVSIANTVLNELAGVVVPDNEADVVAPAPPSIVIRADGLE